jgi:hypothetical protein
MDALVLAVQMHTMLQQGVLMRLLAVPSRRDGMARRRMLVVLSRPGGMARWLCQPSARRSTVRTAMVDPSASCCVTCK